MSNKTIPINRMNNSSLFKKWIIKYTDGNPKANIASDFTRDMKTDSKYPYILGTNDELYEVLSRYYSKFKDLGVNGELIECLFKVCWKNYLLNNQSYDWSNNMDDKDLILEKMSDYEESEEESESESEYINDLLDDLCEEMFVSNNDDLNELLLRLVDENNDENVLNVIKHYVKDFDIENKERLVDEAYKKTKDVLSKHRTNSELVKIAIKFTVRYLEKSKHKKEVIKMLCNQDT